MENPNRKKVDDYGILRAWGDNTLFLEIPKTRGA